ncbi:cyclin-dependent kinase 5 homolog, partial [Actinia tenebrosa]|uniref:Cyclin-dependent kinase 5 homolog n=1 Tax=Actinia tenebrosa TaxID=6105 RepID=A0A6P8HHI9_ACTTE
MGQNHVRFIQNLGSGSYGEVYKAKWDGKIVAAKRIHPLLVRFDPGGENGVVARFVNECELLRRLDHPNILKVLHIIHEPKKPPILITELLDCDLGKHFSENEAVIPLEELVTIMLDVAKGLEYLHLQDVPIIHRDLCPKNILLDKSNPALLRAKICDIGLAKITNDISREFSPVPGTQAYMAPETYGGLNSLYSIQTVRYGTEIDVFSFGMTLLEGIIGKPPFPKENPLAKDEEATVHSQLQADLREMGEDNPLRQLVFDCLEDNPEQRPRAEEIVKTLSDDGFLKEIVKYDFQSQKRKVCEDFHHWIPVRRRTIRELEEMNLDEMTAALDELHRKANIATAAGASTSVLATGLVVGGFIGSFFTFGATIPIMIAGGSIAAAG